MKHISIEGKYYSELTRILNKINLIAFSSTFNLYDEKIEIDKELDKKDTLQLIFSEILYQEGIFYHGFHKIYQAIEGIFLETEFILDHVNFSEASVTFEESLIVTSLMNEIEIPEKSGYEEGQDLFKVNIEGIYNNNNWEFSKYNIIMIDRDKNINLNANQSVRLSLEHKLLDFAKTYDVIPDMLSVNYWDVSIENNALTRLNLCTKDTFLIVSE